MTAHANADGHDRPTPAAARQRLRPSFRLLSVARQVQGLAPTSGPG